MVIGYTVLFAKRLSSKLYYKMAGTLKFISTRSVPLVTMVLVKTCCDKPKKILITYSNVFLSLEYIKIRLKTK